MLLSQYVQATTGTLINGDCEFTRLSTDTRRIQPGDLFVALHGERYDAHAFLRQAADAGACALVVEQADSAITLPQLIVKNTTTALGQIAAKTREAFSGVLIGITGSSGKTTVKGMLAAILAHCGAVKATQGNLNNHIGVPLTLMNLEASDEFAVIEMGTSGSGEIAYLAGLAKPEVALVNNIMPAHLEGFGSLQGIAEEKGQIYGRLGADGNAIINLNDEFAAYFLEMASGSRRWGFYCGTPQLTVPDGVSVVYAKHIAQDALGRAAFELVSEKGAMRIQLAVIGHHNISNALAAAACALAAGVDLEAIRTGLASFTGEPGRMQVGTAWNGASLINDTYNANPGSVRAAINYLGECPQPTVLVLGNLGELGDKAAEAHAELGIYARQKGVDSLLTCGELASEASRAFGDGARHFADQGELAAWLKSHLSASAVVLVKGSRSSRMENVVMALSQTGEKK